MFPEHVSRMERRPRQPAFAPVRAGIAVSASVAKFPALPLHSNQARVLPWSSAFLRLGQDLNQRRFIQLVERRNNRQTANELRESDQTTRSSAPTPEGF